MKPIRRIVAIVDKPRKQQFALRKSLELARLSGARLYLRAFVNERLTGDAAKQRELKRLLVSQRQDWLRNRIDEAMDEADTDVDVEVDAKSLWVNDIAAWMRDSDEVQRAQLVVKSARKADDKFGTLLHKPLDWELVRTCPAPLMICSNVPQRHRRNIVAAIDMNKDTPAHRKLNEKVLDVAATLARLYSLAIHVVYVIEYSEVLADLDIIDVHKHEKSVQREVLPRIRQLVKPFGVPTDNIHMPLGKVGRGVNKVASAQYAKYLVVGSTARRSVFLGDSAAKVMAKTRRDLIVVKP